jgi:hypothetical protein
MKMALFSHSDFDPGDTQEEVVHTDNEVANAWMDVTFLFLMLDGPTCPSSARSLGRSYGAAVQPPVGQYFEYSTAVHSSSSCLFVCLFVCIAL